MTSLHPSILPSGEVRGEATLGYAVKSEMQNIRWKGVDGEKSKLGLLVKPRVGLQLVQEATSLIPKLILDGSDRCIPR